MNILNTFQDKVLVSPNIELTHHLGVIKFCLCCREQSCMVRLKQCFAVSFSADTCSLELPAALQGGEGPGVPRDVWPLRSWQHHWRLPPWSASLPCPRGAKLTGCTHAAASQVISNHSSFIVNLCKFPTPTFNPHLALSLLYFT